jgi:hypothetical protein
MTLFSTGVFILGLLTVLIARDPQAIAHSLFQMLQR